MSNNAASPDNPREIYYGADILAVSLTFAVSENRRKGKLLMGLILAMLLSLGLNLYQFNHLPESKVVSETADGRIRPLPTLDDPIFTDEHVLNWTAQKAELAYDLPFTKLALHPAKLRSFMLDRTADEFIKGLRKAGILDKIAEERIVLRGVRTAPPTLIQRQILKGRYVWTIELPLATIYESAKGKQVEHVSIRMQVGREHLLRSDDGLVIGTFNIYAGAPGGGQP